jgi:hypothetical protein
MRVLRTLLLTAISCLVIPTYAQQTPQTFTLVPQELWAPHTGLQTVVSTTLLTEPTKWSLGHSPVYWGYGVFLGTVNRSGANVAGTDLYLTISWQVTKSIALMPVLGAAYEGEQGSRANYGVYFGLKVAIALK